MPYIIVPNSMKAMMMMIMIYNILRANQHVLVSYR